MIITIPKDDTLPPEFLPLNTWCVWQVATGSDGKLKKTPIDSTGKWVDHVASRFSLSQAEGVAKRNAGGIGISFDNENDNTDLVLIDLDNCMNDAGDMKDWARPIAEKFNGTFSQISFSGKGIHFLCRGKYSGPTGIKFDGEHHGIEIFSRKRFCPLTGRSKATPALPMQEPLDWLANHLLAMLPARPAQTAKPIGQRMPGDWDEIRPRAAAYLAKVEPAMSGQHGHSQTLNTALKVICGFDLTENEAYEVLNEWNQTCQPPWTEAELRRKIGEAGKLMTEARGRFLAESRASQSVTKPREQAEINLAMLGHVETQPFPIDQMPPPFGEYALKAAESIRTHPDLVAVAMLATLGAAVGRSVNVQIRPGWVAWPSCWYCLVSPVGFGKSPSIAFAERELARTDSILVADSVRQLEAWQAECDSLKKGEPKPPKPAMKRVRLRSSTLAALIDCHRQNELGLLYSPDELNSWLAGMGEFSKGGGSDRANWLSARTGGDMSQDRISGVRYVPKSAITIIGGIPPAMLGDLVKGPGDGLIERLMFAFPEHRERPDPPKPEAQGFTLIPQWDTQVLRMFDYRLDDKHQFIDKPVILKLGDKAAGAFHAIECRMNAKLNEDADSPLAGFFSKIPYDVAHWALTIALYEQVVNEPTVNRYPVINADHVQAAGAIADYFLACAAKVVESCGGLRGTDRKIIRRIIKTGDSQIDSKWLNNTFSGRYRPSPETLKAAIKRLTEAGVILGETEAGVYQVNPKCKTLSI